MRVSAGSASLGRWRLKFKERAWPGPSPSRRNLIVVEIYHHIRKYHPVNFRKIREGMKADELSTSNCGTEFRF